MAGTMAGRSALPRGEHFVEKFARHALAARVRASRHLRPAQPENFGVFTDEDGYMQIVGNLTKNNNAAISPLLGKRVAVTGNSQRDAFSGRYVDALKLVASK